MFSQIFSGIKKQIASALKPLPGEQTLLKKPVRKLLMFPHRKKTYLFSQTHSVFISPGSWSLVYPYGATPLSIFSVPI